ncbi:Nucleolar_GTP-binding protein 2 [Hexamita inflata]|uniref:Nucleolar GTP-binding protein 2 n=1 Tax=Hexamita inflata TaxID=28002 RepID=A0AA86NFZ1_9EUKA|nr:Nucleolar GTP-binding protein 2 [Hexamita inflata]CAI9931655.1 Nucleolar GTP-binding protein 2 [Hexamita inflata]
MPRGDTTSIPGRKTLKGGRSQQVIKRLSMQKEQTIRDKEGKIVFERFHGTEAAEDGRIAPNRKWFGNTRVVGQTELDTMREVIDKEKAPNQFLLRSAKLPTALIRDLEPEHVKIEQIEPFNKTFGPKAQRRTAKLATNDPEEMLRQAQMETQGYKHENDINTAENRKIIEENQKNAADPRLTRGATNRIYSEIYKVIDSADVICYVLDARDPEQTRSKHVENYLNLPENEHRHLIYVMNKVDLVPIWSTKSWIQKLSQVHPTIAYCASARKPFGKAELISVLRQFSHIHKDRPNISIGFLGYPNVGKSSVINSLIGKESCKVAPVPGETKVWQYVNLTKKIFMIDAPGVVFPNLIKANHLIQEFNYQNDLKIVLQGVIRCENIEYPEQILPEILKNVVKEHICRTYYIKTYTDSENLMEVLAKKWGRLLKGGEPDKRSVARKILEDYVRGHLPHFVACHDEKEIENYKNSIKLEREKWQHQTDSELIKFVNKQRFGLLNQEFKYLNENLNQEQQKYAKLNEDLAEEPKEENSESSDEKVKEDTESEVQSFGSENLDDVFDAPVEKKLKPKETPVVLKLRQKRQKHIEGVARATRILKTKNQELLRAGRSTLVDEKDLKLVVHEKRLKAKKVRQGGFDHKKTGTHFYDIKRLERKK